jgi:hypothetical protein
VRSSFYMSLVLVLCIVAAGCGGQAAQGPAPGELDRYLSENPEAAARGGQGEPAGINGPAELPQ